MGAADTHAYLMAPKIPSFGEFFRSLSSLLHIILSFTKCRSSFSFIFSSFEHLFEHLSEVLDFDSKLCRGLFAVIGKVLLILEDLPFEVSSPSLARFKTTGDEQLEHLSLRKPE